jgi:hypothetical protein
MELLNLVFILVAGWLVWRRPEREPLAFGLLAASILLMIGVFALATRTSWLPGVNY